MEALLIKTPQGSFVPAGEASMQALDRFKEKKPGDALTSRTPPAPNFRRVQMLPPILPRKSLLSYAKIASGLVIAACFVSPSQASTADMCDSIEGLARMVAVSRQSGIPLMRMIKIADDYKKTPAIRDVAISMVTDAYSRPVYHSPEAKANFVVRFGEVWALACVKEFR